MGIVRDCNPLQLEKTLLLIVVMELGKETDTNPLQPEKAELPMEVTELGIVRAVIKLAP